jgi:hypothetical protein
MLRAGKATLLPFSRVVQRGGAFGELLLDLEEDRAAKAVDFGLLREIERR